MPKNLPQQAVQLYPKFYCCVTKEATQEVAQDFTKEAARELTREAVREFTPCCYT